jgi:hypothetical protein
MKTFTQDLIQLILIGLVAFAYGKANAMEITRGDLDQAIKQSQIELTTLEIQYDIKTLNEVKTTETLTIVLEN